MLMDGRPVFNVTCCDHINLSSLLIHITLLPPRLAVNHRAASTLRNPALPHPLLLLLLSGLISSSVLIAISLYLPSSCPLLLHAVCRWP